MEKWLARYQTESKGWQPWLEFANFKDALEMIQTLAKGQPFEVVRADLIYTTTEHLNKAVQIMEKSKAAFKSKLIAIARGEVEKAIAILQE